MEDGLLSLKWNNHKITFFEILRVLREKANFTDATIAVEGKFYPVHKLVMSTCSEYFSEIFERTPCKSPVIVLKDVRSQDMDALLDYMYLGEVNVNQNDLASLLKTAECLRIKGLAVPDEDPTKSRKAPSDDRRESPPPKRRRQEDPPAPAPPPRPVSPNISASSKTTPSTQTSPLQHQSSSLSVSHHQDNVQDSVLDPPPMVKVEMEDTQDPDDVYRRDNSYEGGSLNEGDGGDFGTELSKSEHDPDNYGSGSFPGPSIQPGGDLPWDEGDSSSFPPEGFSGDLPTGQQPQGDKCVLAGWLGGEETFRCHLCSVHCGSANDLRRHVMTHTGEKPFLCQYCSHRTARKYNLKKHMRDVHGVPLELLWPNSGSNTSLESQ
ncbi:zinc finger and BTB domain-containing protein 49-like isoform X6 [Homarus americanus]|uniref:zinc finger and BTB domain-containing protein 49-like isoform X6 n=1 Tax=Homarus americanus TaxID=6706 RepID=UPI001C4756CB|nr:zinc finger and BTB domain-containing protein 49-like isoform X6 [Homarus americanus]